MMITFKVWVLIYYLGVTSYRSEGGGPLVIDNIATKDECVRVMNELNNFESVRRRAMCIEVTKVKPKK